MLTIYGAYSLQCLTLRLPCYSCMSPYLEDHYPYISHLYRKPLSFDSHCDRNNLDRRYLFVKNCSDMCVTLRINDIVGGRRRHGYVRGCLSDIHGYNHSLIRALAERTGCLGRFSIASSIQLHQARLLMIGRISGLYNDSECSTDVSSQCCHPAKQVVSIRRCYRDGGLSKPGE
ncbi:unnamed protein product [Angiostrongylus costaricensis]|uniref:Gnk2-homologous domain-containing protein n=1 Tax=Angiostrongylus costaricensis TaxID=334426 RepID=A0A158PG34_ANGCS|nr:unnamed protein product [Angiostrongylus costaricensis]